jgi:hypothetical protein
VSRLQSCPCGSGEFPEVLKDGYGIFIAYACRKCKKEKLESFRPDIFTRYDTDEQIESD